MFLIDNNLSPRLETRLKTIFPGLLHVENIDLDESEDIVIWQYAQENNLGILTKDSDFNDLQVLHGFPPKIVWIRSGNVSTQTIIDTITEHAVQIRKFLDNQAYGILEIS